MDYGSFSSSSEKEGSNKYLENKLSSIDEQEDSENFSISYNYETNNNFNLSEDQEISSQIDLFKNNKWNLDKIPRHLSNSDLENWTLNHAAKFIHKLKEENNINYSFLIVENEFHTPKFIFSFIIPSPLASWKLADIEQSVNFISGYLSLIPLEVPLAFPKKLNSPVTTLNKKSGNCFELCNVLTSMLRGLGYDAYCVSGNFKNTSESFYSSNNLNEMELYCWVFVKENMCLNKKIYIDAASGLIFKDLEFPFNAIYCVWNDSNYWVAIKQDIFQNLDFSDKSTFIPFFESSEPSLNDNFLTTERKYIRLSTWSPSFVIDENILEKKFPQDGKRIIETEEIITEYHCNSLEHLNEGLFKRIYPKNNFNNEGKEFFENRRDLKKEKNWNKKLSTYKEDFCYGRDDFLMSYSSSKDELELKFSFHRTEGIISHKEVFGNKIIQYYNFREDGLIKQSVSWSIIDSNKNQDILCISKYYKDSNKFVWINQAFENLSKIVFIKGIEEKIKIVYNNSNGSLIKPITMFKKIETALHIDTKIDKWKYKHKDINLTNKELLFLEKVKEIAFWEWENIFYKNIQQIKLNLNQEKNIKNKTTINQTPISETNLKLLPNPQKFSFLSSHNISLEDSWKKLFKKNFLERHIIFSDGNSDYRAIVKSCRNELRESILKKFNLISKWFDKFKSSSVKDLSNKDYSDIQEFNPYNNNTPSSDLLFKLTVLSERQKQIQVEAVLKFVILEKVLIEDERFKFSDLF